MRFIAVDRSIEIEYDDNIWKASENFQGSIVTFRAPEENKDGFAPTLSVFEYPDNPIPLRQIMENTIEQISKMLSDLYYEIVDQDRTKVEFTYSGLVNGVKLKLYQRIERRRHIYSITYGCDSARYERYEKEFDALLSNIMYEQ